MEDLILISNLNDFIFCPVSIYFHKLYGNQDNLTYFDNVQWNGRKPRIKSDYVNVVLDIGYTMLFNIVDAMLQVYGFDTYYGVFHKCFYMRKSLVCDIMEPIRPIIDYEVRKAINLGQCKIDDFEKYNEHWCLKYKNNPQYIQFLMQAIMEYKDEIFMYIQSYYRYFMKMKSVSEFAKYLSRFGHRLQYSVFEIDNSEKIVNNIVNDLKNKYEKSFSQEDSVIIFKLSSSCEVLRFGYAKNDEKDFIIIS